MVCVCVCVRARARARAYRVYLSASYGSQLTAIISLYGVSWSPAIQATHTPHTNSVLSSFIFHYMFRPYILTLIRWIQVQKEKCYRRGLPFTVDLLKCIRYCPPPPKKKDSETWKSIKLSIKFLLNPECHKWILGCVCTFCCVDCTRIC